MKIDHRFFCYILLLLNSAVLSHKAIWKALEAFLRGIAGCHHFVSYWWSNLALGLILPNVWIHTRRHRAGCLLSCSGGSQVLITKTKSNDVGNWKFTAATVKLVGICAKLLAVVVVWYWTGKIKRIESGDWETCNTLLNRNFVRSSYVNMCKAFRIVCGICQTKPINISFLLYNIAGWIKM